jgi:cytochrome c
MLLLQAVTCRIRYHPGRPFIILSQTGVFMKLHIALLATGLAFAGGALGQAKVDAKAAEALAQKSGCIACHNVDKKVIGPAYKDVAAKYKADKDAETKLAAKVKAGGSGVWGPVPMPPNAQVSDADIKTLVAWIMSLK